MNREEAINTVRNIYQTDKEKEALGVLIPELRESEDERIRKALVKQFGGCIKDDEFCHTGFTYAEITAWLEKQKEPHKRLRDKTPWIVTAKEELAHAEERLQANLEELHRIRAEKEKQKEQKPNSTEDMPYIADEHFFEQEPADSFKYKLAEYMTKSCTKKESPYGYSYSINSESILQMAKEELIKRGELKEQKPVEWSEEDEKIMQTMIKEGDLKPSEIAWLKSLRPQYNGDVTMTEAYKMGKEAGEASHWKPSEEHLSALLAIFNDPDNIGSQTCQLALTDLYEHLKKL